MANSNAMDLSIISVDRKWPLYDGMCAEMEKMRDEIIGLLRLSWSKLTSSIFMCRKRLVLSKEPCCSLLQGWKEQPAPMLYSLKRLNFCLCCQFKELSFSPSLLHCRQYRVQKLYRTFSMICSPWHLFFEVTEQTHTSTNNLKKYYTMMWFEMVAKINSHTAPYLNLHLIKRDWEAISLRAPSAK